METTSPATNKTPYHPWLYIAPFLTGIASFFPIGITYLAWILFTVTLLTIPDAKKRIHCFFQNPIAIVIIMPAALASISVLIHGTHEQTATRLFHTFRNSAIIISGLIILQWQREWIIRGLFAGGLYALSIIFIDKFIVNLPIISPYGDLLRVEGNSGSQKMILLSTTGALSFFLATWTDDQKKRMVYLLFWLLTSATVATHSISRNAYLITIILPALALIYRFRRPNGIAIAILFFTALCSMIWMGSETVRIRVQQAISELHSFHKDGSYNGSANVRAKMMMESTKQMISNPLFGTGTGSWLEHWRKVSANSPEAAGINNPHNDYLLAGMENGIPGFLAILGMMTAFLYINWKANDLWGGLGFLTTVSLCITAAINAPFRDAALGMALVWLMAAFTKLSHPG